MTRFLFHILVAATLFQAVPSVAIVPELRAKGLPNVAPQFLLPAPERAVPFTVTSPAPRKTELGSYGVTTTAMSSLVLDVGSGELLYADDADVPRPMGSITKLMAAMVLLDGKPNLASKTILTDAEYVFGGRIYLAFQDPLSIKDLLGASVVGSDNVATMGFARALGISLDEFVSRMNAKATELGLADTHFADPTGLSAENVSTARELSVLLLEAQKYPDILAFMKRSEITIYQSSGRAVTIGSTDALLSNPHDAFTVTGGKTGYIPEAGYCLAVALERDGREVVVVVLAADTKEARFADATALASWAFDTFTWSE